MAGTDDAQAALAVEIVDHVAYVVAFLGTQDLSVEAGHVIISGSVLPPLAIAPGDELQYVLDPGGELEIHVAD